MTFLGADPEQLDLLARDFEQAAERLDAAYSTVEVRVVRSAWDGGDADGFRQAWTGGCRRAFSAAAAHLRQGATTLRANAEDQRRASAGDGGAIGGVGGEVPGPSAGEDDDGLRATIEKIAEGLGLGKDALELLLDQLGVLDPGAVAALGTFLAAHPVVLETLGILGEVIDIGQVVVDFAVDWIDHAHLPVDERLLHSLAFAGVGVAASEGAKWVTAKIGGALASMAATPIGGAAGYLGGFAMGFAIEKIFEASGAQGFVADAALEAYQEAKEVGGVVIDAVSDGVDTVVDGAENVADTIVEGGQHVVGGIIDGGQSVVGTIGGWLR